MTSRPKPASGPEPRVAGQLTPFTGKNTFFTLGFAAWRYESSIDFTFQLQGQPGVQLRELLVLPEPVLREPNQSEPAGAGIFVCQRLDQLWTTTCLEVFVGPKDQQNYLELNLSPGGDWNIYAFDSTRSGMRPAQDARAPLDKFSFTAEPNGVETLIWTASLASESTARMTEISEVGQCLSAPSLVMSATAVVEYRNGERDYWAVTHRGQQPDFHRRDSFVFQLDSVLSD